MSVNKNAKKPQYDMAPEWPLVLYDCGFEGILFENDDGTFPNEKSEGTVLMVHIQRALVSFMPISSVYGMNVISKPTFWALYFPSSKDAIVSRTKKR